MHYSKNVLDASKNCELIFFVMRPGSQGSLGCLQYKSLQFSNIVSLILFRLHLLLQFKSQIFDWIEVRRVRRPFLLPLQVNLVPGTNARKVNCGRVYSAYIFLWANFVNKNRCISVGLVSVHIIVSLIFLCDGSHVRL